MLDVNQPTASDLSDALLAAFDRRAALHADPAQTAYRLFHGHGEGCPGLTVDRLGPALVVTHRSELEAVVNKGLKPLVARLVPRLVVMKLRWGKSQPRVVHGLPEKLVEVVDNGLKFEIEPLAPRNGGLYLDARPARAWLLANSTQRRILNLFAYTGSLGIAAASGGARWVIHVELQKRQLRRIKRNLSLNGLPVDDRNLVREDLYKYLRRVNKKGLAVDGVILDPPPMVPGRDPRGQDYAGLSRLAAPLLAPGGWLLCFFHRRERRRGDCEQEVLDASPFPLLVLHRGTSGDEFPETDPEARLRFTAFVRPRRTAPVEVRR